MNFSIIQDIKDLPSFKKKELLCIDCETVSHDDKEGGLHFWKEKSWVAGWGISTCEKDVNQRRVYYIPIRHVLTTLSPYKNLEINPVIDWMKNEVFTKDLVNHNIKFDLKFAYKDGLYPQGKCICTATMARLVNNEFLRLNLGALSNFYLGETKLDTEVKAYLRSIKSKDYGKVPIDILARYTCEGDLRLTVNLYHILKEEMPKESLELWETEIALTKVLLNAEITGIRVDTEALKRISKVYIQKQIDALVKINTEMGDKAKALDPNSPQSIKKFLISNFGLTSSKKTAKGNPSWDYNSLKATNNPVASAIADFSKASHYYNTFCEGYSIRLSSDNYLYGNFNQFGTNSGRLSSNDPNLQNASKEAMQTLCPHPDCIVFGFDYSQIEYRIVAHYGNDERIISAYSTDPFTDFHQRIADILGIPRQQAKTVNFALIYGAGKPKLLLMLAVSILDNLKNEHITKKLFEFLGITEQEKMVFNDRKIDYLVNAIYDKYHKEVPMVRSLQKAIKKRVYEVKKLRNFFGRVYRFPNPEMHYVGLNRLGQGTAGDFVKKKLVELHEKILNELPNKNSPSLLTTVHDSFFLSIPKEQATYELYSKIKSTLEDHTTFRVPITVTGKIGHKNLADCVEFTKDFPDTKENVEKVITYGKAT